MPSAAIRVKIPCTSLWIQKKEAASENNGVEAPEATKV